MLELVYLFVISSHPLLCMPEREGRGEGGGESVRVCVCVCVCEIPPTRSI